MSRGSGWGTEGLLWGLLLSRVGGGNLCQRPRGGTEKGAASVGVQKDIGGKGRLGVGKKAGAKGCTRECSRTLGLLETFIPVAWMEATDGETRRGLAFHFCLGSARGPQGKANLRQKKKRNKEGPSSRMARSKDECESVLKRTPPSRPKQKREDVNLEP